MRGIDTPVRKMRREIFKEIAQLAYHSDNLNDDVEALPYKIVNPETPIYRESIYREREIVREQIRLAMGLSLRPEDAPVHVTQGLEESNIDEKYYEPPMIQVIPSACNACPENEYCVTDRCMGCVAHPCQVVCPRGAISTVNGKSVIDQSKCIRCGKCKSVCPYDAVSHQQRPCSAACGVGALGEAFDWPVPVTMMLSLAAGITVSISGNKLLFKNADGIEIGSKTLSDAEGKKIGDVLDETTNSSFANKNLGEVLKQQRLTFCCCNIRW